MLIALPPQIDALDHLAEEVDRYATDAGVPPADAMRLNLVLDELFTNIVSYGRSPDDATVDITLTRRDGATDVCIEDRGRPFDPLTIPPPDLDSALEDRPLGGLGLHFLITFMTDLVYCHTGETNRLTFRQQDRPETDSTDNGDAPDAD